MIYIIYWELSLALLGQCYVVLFSDYVSVFMPALQTSTFGCLLYIVLNISQS